MAAVALALVVLLMPAAVALAGSGPSAGDNQYTDPLAGTPTSTGASSMKAPSNGGGSAKTPPPAAPAVAAPSATPTATGVASTTVPASTPPAPTSARRPKAAHHAGTARIAHHRDGLPGVGRVGSARWLADVAVSIGGWMARPAAGSS